MKRRYVCAAIRVKCVCSSKVKFCRFRNSSSSFFHSFFLFRVLLLSFFFGER